MEWLDHHPYLMGILLAIFCTIAYATGDHGEKPKEKEVPPPPAPPQPTQDDTPGFLDSLAKAVQKGYQRRVPQSIVIYQGVTVNYRFEGTLIELSEIGEKTDEFITKTDAKIKQLIDNDRNIDLTHFENTLKIKVLSVQRSARQSNNQPTTDSSGDLIL